MSQLTIRGFDPELEHHLRALAEREGISLNQAALRLMKRGAGLDCREVPVKQPIGAALDAFIGTWTEDEAREIEAATADFSQIDADLWR